MKRRSFITIVLLLFAGASVAYVIVKEVQDRPHAGELDQTGMASVSAEEHKEASEDRVVAYYFHGDARCATCRKLEAYTSETITNDFLRALESGALDWRAVNVDNPENEHFVSDYQLTTRSVVLVKGVGGERERWKNLDRIWDLVTDKAAFQTYIARETEAFLRGE